MDAPSEFMKQKLQIKEALKNEAAKFEKKFLKSKAVEI